jgi:hypothetical protein
MGHNAIVVVGVFLLAACGNVLPAPTPTPAPPAFEIATGKSADTITYATQNHRVTFDVHSARGIGSARITQTGGAAPEHITLRLHLRALEHFKFTFDNQSVEIEIPTPGTDHTPRESVSPDGALYMPVKIFSRDDAYPIQEGYIQIELPRAYFDAGAREFSIEWIDFYR